MADYARGEATIVFPVHPKVDNPSLIAIGQGVGE